MKAEIAPYKYPRAIEYLDSSVKSAEEIRRYTGYAAIGILAALRSRTHTGRGQMVELPQVELLVVKRRDLWEGAHGVKRKVRP